MKISSKPSTKKFRDNHDRIFKRKTAPNKSTVAKKSRKVKTTKHKKTLKYLDDVMQKQTLCIESAADNILRLWQKVGVILGKIEEIETKIGRYDEISLARRFMRLERELDEKLQITRTLEKAMEKAYNQKEEVNGTQPS